ncbi:MAG TPA: hypothetical protein VLY21_03645 [Nitrososphaerales archaeon]|nr:hypothetical protein [Nitrososphaerales archaeon]
MTAVFVALLLLVSLAAGYFYLAAGQEASASHNYANELNESLADNRALGGTLTSALQEYNASLVYLAQVVSNMNTTSTAYQNASRELPTLWHEYLVLVRAGQAKVETYSVDMLVDYGNGTSRWTNDTVVQPGWNVYTATIVALPGKVQSTWYPYLTGGEDFVDSINGVGYTATTSWFLWTEEAGSWQLASTGANLIPAYNGTVYAWTLCGFDQNYQPTCSP